jgi:hypothetical protein
VDPGRFTDRELPDVECRADKRLQPGLRYLNTAVCLTPTDIWEYGRLQRNKRLVCNKQLKILKFRNSEPIE